VINFIAMEISIPGKGGIKIKHNFNFPQGLADYIHRLGKTIDKYLRKTWLGKSQLDRLLEDQLKQGTEQVYLAYRKPLLWFLQSKIDHPFTTIGIYKESTHESEICKEMDYCIKSGRLNYNTIRNHLDARTNALLKSCKGTFGTELFETYSMCKLIELQASPSKFEAAKLKTIMDRNIFSQGVTLAHGYLTEEVKRNKLFKLHFHVGDDYISASAFDIDFYRNLPFVVCSYSKTRNRTEVSLLYKVFGDDTTLIGLRKGRLAPIDRYIKLIVGYYGNNEIIPALAQPYLNKPEMSVKRLSDYEYVITCKTQAPPLMLEVWGIEDQTGSYHGSIKGTDEGAFDPPEHWRDYRKIDSGGFRVKFRTPEDAKNLIFCFFNHDYLGASIYCDQHV
jgi:hypothetical protein